MRYLPKSPADRKEMLAEIGVASIDDLFSTIPAEYRLKRDLNVPRQHGESGDSGSLSCVCGEQCCWVCELSGRGSVPALSAGDHRFAGVSVGSF